LFNFLKKLSLLGLKFKEAIYNLYYYINMKLYFILGKYSINKKLRMHKKEGFERHRS